MRVIVSDTVFGAASFQDLHKLLGLCSDGRHLVEIDPLDGPGWQAFLGRRSLQDREYFQGIIDTCLQELARSGQPTALRIPDVPLIDALRILSAPLHVVVENKRNDGAFLKAVALGPQRREIRTALEKGWLDFENGGGLDEISERVKAKHFDSRRTFVVADSDAREPGAPSRQAARLAQLCVDHALGHHILYRRERENYLPLTALQFWLEKSSRQRQRTKRSLLGHFRALSPAQRHHFNMREGLKGDGDAVSSLYAEVGLPAQRALQDGFAKDVGKLFETGSDDGCLTEDWLLEDGQRDESQKLFGALLARL
jgi:hypothetical protein